MSQFIDTPVKRYSSGMYLRLAFAVAAHLDTEILVVDEVLAVGDASFQKKCLAKMEDVGQHGRTVVFVSHNMMAVTRLCQRTILLDEGRVIADGPSHEIVSDYLRSGLGTTAHREWHDLDCFARQRSRPPALRCGLRSLVGEISEAMDIRKPVRVEMEFDVLSPGHSLVPNFHFFNEEGICVFIAGDHDPEWERRTGRSASLTTAWIPGNYLSEGSLVVSAAISTMDPVIVHFFERDAVAFQVIDSLDGDSARGDYAGPIPGGRAPTATMDDELRAGGFSITRRMSTRRHESRVARRRARHPARRRDGDEAQADGRDRRASRSSGTS